MLEVVYSYWDGSGHRKSIEVRKGTTIGKFLELVKAQLVGEFHEVRSTSAEDLIYVKEDLIIPQVSGREEYALKWIGVVACVLHVLISYVAIPLHDDVVVFSCLWRVFH